MTNFVHLRLHSEFSISDSSIGIEQAIKIAKDNKMHSLAITDLNNGFAWIKFYQAARKNNIKPILGSDINVNNEQLLFLIQNNTGYLNMCKILSKTWESGEPCIIKESILEITPNLDGIILFSGNPKSNIYKFLLNNNFDLALQEAVYWLNILGDRFYLEIQHNIDSNIIWPQIIQISKQLNIPLVAAHPIQFLYKEDFEAHEVRVCIAKGDILGNQNRKVEFNNEQYFKPSLEMFEMFKLLPSSLTNTVEIAKRCNLNLNLNQPKLPFFPTPNNITLNDFLRQESRQGLDKRLIKNKILLEKHQEYKDRLEFEVDTIIQMGFSGYFLIVADFINWAKNNDIPVGPGRGSGAGSLVAYVLGITDIDPLPYNLLFERFLNPERVSMPDFDIDFCQHGRDKVIQYVKSKYGVDAVSQIATFGTMAAKAVVRDVGRVLDLGYNFVDGIAKLIPFKPTKHVTIKSSLEEEPLLAQREEKEEEVKLLLNLAQKLEGLARNVGMHAGGVLIAPGKLTDFCPLYSQDGTSIISQYDKDDVESVGLVKFDFLGLTTLTILDIAQKHVKRLIDKEFNYQDIPLNVKNAFDILKTANTVSVFQLESRGMQSMLKDALPDRFEDIIALVSLYRPGPMDLIPTYIKRKHKKEVVVYPDIRVEPVLKETYGIMVYQEQVMQMAQIVGGYTLGGADLLRRAMGKKKPEEMAEHRLIFREGAAKNGLDAQKADEIFDLMEKFAGYGFNKSHATAYALIAYYTAWFKANHIECFMAANLTLAMDDNEKTAILIQDCKNNKIKILPPNIHQSHYEFIPYKPNTDENGITVMYGLGAVKGLGKSAIEHIINQRQYGNFTSLFDFAQRIDKKLVNKRAFEALVKSGAFDCFNENRGTLFANISKALELSEQISSQKHQVSLFEDAKEAPLPKLIENNWDLYTKLKEEKSALGYYFSGHLFDVYRDKYKHLIKQTIIKVEKGKDKTIVGIITAMRTQITNRGKMIVATIDDSTNFIECTIFSELIEQMQFYLKEDTCVLIKGEVKFDHFNQSLRINANKIYTIEQASINLAQEIIIYIDYPPKIEAQKIISKIGNFGVNLTIKYTNTEQKYACSIKLPNALKLPLSDEYLKYLDTLQITYKIIT